MIKLSFLSTLCYISSYILFTVPGAPPRKLEVEAVNSTAIRVTWKPPLSGKQHGQIRGYQVIYSRLENGEPRGHPNIMDVALPEAQVRTLTKKLLLLLLFYNSLYFTNRGHCVISPYLFFFLLESTFFLQFVFCFVFLFLLK